MVGPCGFCCCDDFFICRIESAVADVFHDGSLEQPRILQDHTEGIAQLSAVEVFDVVSIDLDCPAVDIIKTHQQFDHGCLSGSGRSYDRGFLARFYFGAEIVDDDLLRVVAEMYVVEGDFSCHSLDCCRILDNLVFLFLVQEFKDTLGCRRHRLYHVDNLRNLLNRLGKVFHILDKCLDITDRDHVFDRQKSAGQCHAGVA